VTEEAPPAPPRATARGRLLLLVSTVAAVAAAYQVARPVIVDFDSPLPVPVSSRGVYPVEDGFRWTSGRSVIGVAGPGPGRTVRVEAVLSAWRPRGVPPTQVRLGVGAAAATATMGPAPVPVVVTADTAPWPRGDVELRLDSGTFAPGAGDPRVLGVRVHQLRVSDMRGTFAPGLPPLLPLLWTLFAVQVLFQVALRSARDPKAALRSGLAAAGLAAVGLAAARGWTVWLMPWIAAAALVHQPLVQRLVLVIPG
jgi:hypothetical protein